MKVLFSKFAQQELIDAVAYYELEYEELSHALHFVQHLQPKTFHLSPTFLNPVPPTYIPRQFA